MEDQKQMGAKKNARHNDAAQGIRKRIPEAADFNPIPALDPKYLDALMGLRRDCAEIESELAPLIREKKRDHVLYLTDLEEMVSVLLPESNAESLRAMYQTQKEQLEEQLLNLFFNRMVRMWLGERSAGNDLMYYAYSDGRCMDCFRERRATSGWLRTQYTLLGRFSSYEELRKHIPLVLIRDSELEENEGVRHRLAPQCKRHPEPQILTLGHSVMTAEQPRYIAEARLKASIAPKIVEWLLGEKGTHKNRAVIDDYLAMRCRANSPDIWRKMVMTLRDWTPTGTFESRLNIKGYSTDELDDLVRTAIQHDRDLTSFYRKRLQSQLREAGSGEAGNACFVEAILPMTSDGSNMVAVHFYDESQYSKKMGHRTYKDMKEESIINSWSPLALLILMKVVPVFVAPFLQEYTREVYARGLERFRDTPVYV